MFEVNSANEIKSTHTHTLEPARTRTARRDREEGICLIYDWNACVFVCASVHVLAGGTLFPLLFVCR